MARAIQSIRFLLAVVLGAAILLMLLAMIGGWYFERAERPPREAARSKTQRPVDEPETTEPPPATAAPSPGKKRKRPTWKVEGPTRFVRRLAAGKYYMVLAREMEKRTPAKDRVDGWLRVLRKHLLRADGATPPGILPALDHLTRPRRDRDALNLHEGADGLIRVWTLQARFDVPTVQRTGELLMQLIAEAGHPMPQGVDILVTPKMGCDLFPEQKHLSRAAGVYFRRDRYCVVRSTLRNRFREQVIRHETVHAYVSGPVKLRSAPRFVTEGLAEYLRFLSLRDGGLQVPPSAMRDHLANLDRAFAEMERLGFDLSRVKPKWLVRLSPWNFYRLPHGYAVALAMHAYVGGAPILRSLRSRSPDPLVAALEGIDWRKFRVWLKYHADGGDPGAASFVDDSTLENGDGTINGTTQWTVLRMIGARPPKKYAKLVEASMAAMSTPEQIEAVIRRLLAPGGAPVTIASDLSATMDRTLGSVDLPEAWEDEGATTFLTSTPRELVASLHRRLGHDPGAKPTLIGITIDTRERDDARPLLPYTVDRLPAWLSKQGAPQMRLVVCSSGARSKRSEKHLVELQELMPANATILIVDLASGQDSDAACFAKALAERGPGFNVAYWRP